jgi:mono/diheme cytochrome c family protein
MRIAGLGALGAVLILVNPVGAQEDVGKATFDRHCAHCHGPGDEAVGTVHLARTRGDSFALLTERDDLVAPYIEFVVRNGLRSMPSFLPSDLTEAQLDALTKYLTGDPTSR